jgi:hypothetical protein
MIVGKKGNLASSFFCIGKSLNKRAWLWFDLKSNFNVIILLFDFVLDEVSEMGSLFLCEQGEEEH